MCTLALAFRARPEAALAVTANRDELYDRPAAPPRVEGGVLAPEDLRGGGTWLGFTAGGLFVGVTNRAGAMRDAARRSRGLLVREALRAQSARELHAQLAGVPGDRHNGFHLLYADRAAAFVTWCDGERLQQLELSPGVHVFTERSFGAAETQREPVVRAALENVVAQPQLTLQALREIVRRHGPDEAPLDGACVHADSFGYGTRSSLQLIVPARGEPTALWTEGHPCTEPARDLAPELAALLGQR